MKFMRTTFIITLFTALFTLTSCSQSPSPQKKELLDQGWEFQLQGQSTWEPVDLPHDWSVSNDFDSLAPAGNDGGYLPTAKITYRRKLDIGQKSNDLLYTLLFEGAYMNPVVSINGQEAGSWPYGYSTFQVDATPYLHDGDNDIEVIVDNTQQKNCRWYTGTGIYRHVWLVVTGEIYVDPWSLQITTPLVSEKEAKVEVNFDITNFTVDSPNVNVVVEIFDKDKEIAQQSQQVILIDSITPLSFSFDLDNPRLWTPDTPNLYEAKITIKQGSTTLFQDSQTFGVRTIEYDSENGLRLNGQPILLNGGCVHHDNGLLGAASYDAAEARKVKLMKDAGFNAVRTSHNPPAPAFLDECDRQGLIVIDEAFDGWRQAKNTHDYSELFDQWALRDIEAMVLRDRNHPSVMAWSIGNEILERKSPEAVATSRVLADKCRQLDPTRPVTQALASWDADWEIYDPLAAEHDIVGYNYMIHKSEGDHQRVPERVMWQTESYPRDAFQNWVKVNDNPYIIGDFVWTAIDYLGESGIGRHYYQGESEGEHYERNQWPWHGALCGDIDLLGQRRPISYYRQMLYSDQPALHMAVREPDGYKGKIRETLWGHYPTYDHWNWTGHEGKPIEVLITTNAPSVKLFLNDELIGEKPVSRDTRFQALFSLPYQPGTLRAEASNGLKQEIATAEAPFAIRLTADKEKLAASNQDLSYILAEIVDKNGRVVPDSDMELSFDVTGEGVLLATGSADVKDIHGYHQSNRLTNQGKAMAIVKSTGTPGAIYVTAKSPHMSATLNLTSK